MGMVVEAEVSVEDTVETRAVEGQDCLRTRGGDDARNGTTGLIYERHGVGALKGVGQALCRRLILGVYALNIPYLAGPRYLKYLKHKLSNACSSTISNLPC